MWTRGKDRNDATKFEIEVFNGYGQLVIRLGGFATAQLADRAAEKEQRNVLFGYVSEDDDYMTDDELLAELMA